MSDSHHLLKLRFLFLNDSNFTSYSRVIHYNGRPTILIPLLFVLTVKAIKDAVEDHQRYIQDNKKNSAEYEVYNVDKQQWVSTLSKKVCVGDFIRVKNDQRVPADCLLVSSGLDKGSYVFVDTKELDGETNLKPRKVPPLLLHSMRNNHKDVNHLSLFLKCDANKSDTTETVCINLIVVNRSSEASKAVIIRAVLHQLQLHLDEIGCKPSHTNYIHSDDEKTDAVPTTPASRKRSSIPSQPTPSSNDAPGKLRHSPRIPSSKKQQPSRHDEVASSTDTTADRNGIRSKVQRTLSSDSTSRARVSNHQS